jgi:hypothetical protein
LERDLLGAILRFKKGDDGTGVPEIHRREGKKWLR